MVALFAQQSNITPFPTQQKSNEWYTPSRYIEAARKVMDGIDLDPASCFEANQTVRAKHYYTVRDNGLAQEWHGNVWLNPPLTRDNSQSNERRSAITKWTSTLISHYQSGKISQAILLVTTRTDTRWFRLLWDYPICFTDHTIRFYLPHGRTNNPACKTNAHVQGTIFVYLGSNEQKFIDVFSQFGRIAKAVDTPRQKATPLSLWEEVSPCQ